MSLSRTLGGIALVLAALLNLTRMIPIVANFPEGLEVFPPQTADQIALLHLENTVGVVISHIMALASFPLYLIGCLFLFSLLKERNQQYFGVPALVLLSFGFFLFAIAVIVDGFVLHLVAEYFTTAPEHANEVASFLVSTSASNRHTNDITASE